jgi:hypothetical protein
MIPWTTSSTIFLLVMMANIPSRVSVRAAYNEWLTGRSSRRKPCKFDFVLPNMPLGRNRKKLFCNKPLPRFIFSFKRNFSSFLVELSPFSSWLRFVKPNAWRVSRLAGCAYVDPVYSIQHRRRHAPYLLAEGQGLPPRLPPRSITTRSCSLSCDVCEAGENAQVRFDL